MQDVIKILMIERQECWHRFLVDALRGQPFKVFSALNVEQGRQFFAENPDVDIIVISDCVPMGKEEVENALLDFVREIRKNFLGKIVATSSNCIYGDQLVKAGCDFQTVKSHLSERIFEISSSFAER
jgi:hypothetical protein